MSSESKEQRTVELQQALAAARQHGDRLVEAEALYELGNHDWDDKLGSIAYNEQALPIAREIEDEVLEARVLTTLASLHALAANEYYERALPIAQRRAESLKRTGLLENLAQVKMVFLNEPQQALPLFEQELAIAREKADRADEARTLRNMASAYNYLMQLEQAINFYQQALVIARDTGDLQSEFSLLTTNLGQLYRSAGRPQEAISHFEAGLTLMEKLGNKNSPHGAVVLLQVGECYEALGDYPTALDYMERALGTGQSEDSHPHLRTTIEEHIDRLKAKIKHNQ
jgi:tetratricopeptide (TPR) repeat protein